MIPLDASKHQLTGFLPTCYRLVPEAKRFFADWYDQLDRLRITETHQGLQAVYSKMQGYTGRLALILHCLNAAVVGQQPSEDVGGRMRSAMKLVRWFMGQVRLLYAEGDGGIGADLRQAHPALAGTGMANGARCAQF